MAKPADKVVSLAELRFRPANSNDAARAVLSHHFINVPRCSFARDDGISYYLGAETGIAIFPTSPDAGAPQDVDVPAIRGELPAAPPSLRRKLLRGGFALSVLLHATAAIAIGYATLTLPDDATLEEGTLSVTLMVEGNAEAGARAAGADEDVKEIEEKAVEKQPEPVKQAELQKPVQATTETILKDVPMPVLGANLPEILTSKAAADAKSEAVATSPTAEKVEIPTEKPVEQTEKPVKKKPDEKPRPVEKQAEPKKLPEKERPKEKRRQNRGNQGDQLSNARKGEVDARDKGKVATNSRGDTANRETGNASRSNYKGLVSRKLSRAKGRMPSPAKGKLWVTFTILADGSISGLSITQSSGKPALDATALKVVRAASPFPPIPEETGLKRWKMSVPMTFTGR